MYRLAYVINYIVKNGPSSVVLNLINNLDKEKYDITLITLFSGNDKEVVTSLKGKGVKVYECKALSRMKCMMGQSAEFEDVVRRGRYDILHTHGLIPDIISARLRFPVKRMTTIHNNMYEDYLDSYGRVKSKIFIAMHLNALRKLDRCVCCSESVYEVMKKKLHNITFIRNGIEPTVVYTAITREELHIPKDAKVFIYAGALNYRKNVERLIENFVRYHNESEYLLVLGEGEKEAECKARADGYVRMMGFQKDIIAYMNISDVYMSASRSEGFSISVLEALSCGLGLFLSDIPSHREIVTAGRSVPVGVLFKESSMEIAFSEIRQMLSKTKKSEISKFQEEHLSASRMAELYGEEYQQLGDLK